MQQTDSDILIRCQHGDKAAFRSVVEDPSEDGVLAVAEDAL